MFSFTNSNLETMGDDVHHLLQVWQQCASLAPLDVEKPRFVDHFPRETLVFPISVSVCPVPENVKENPEKPY
jgi:hypothetical protein